MSNEVARLDVLVTFYNQEKYVDRALESVFSQQCNFSFNVLVWQYLHCAVSDVDWVDQHLDSLPATDYVAAQ